MEKIYIHTSRLVRTSCCYDSIPWTPNLILLKSSGTCLTHPNSSRLNEEDNAKSNKSTPSWTERRKAIWLQTLLILNKCWQVTDILQFQGKKETKSKRQQLCSNKRGSCLICTWSFGLWRKLLKVPLYALKKNLFILDQIHTVLVIVFILTSCLANTGFHRPQKRKSLGSSALTWSAN